MPAQNILVLLLPLGAIQDQPVGGGISHAVAEYQIQSPSNLINEVVHVALETAIVIAGEDHPFLVVDEDPARSMYGGDPGKIAPDIDVARGPLHYPEKETHCPKTKAPRFDRTNDRELIGNIVVLKMREFAPVAQVDPRSDFRICLLTAAERIDKNRQVKDQKRGQ